VGPDSREEPVLPSLQNWGWWTIVANGIYFLEEKSGTFSLRYYDLARGAAVLVAELPARVIDAAPAITASFDLRSIVYVQIDPGSSDVMLVENFR
jgi:hypothetical protein